MNRKILCVALALAACVALVENASAAFIAGNLVVSRVGTGAAALNANATAVFLDEYDNSTAAQAAPIQSLALPTAAAGSDAALTLSGSSTSEGFIAQSLDGTYLTIGGYNAAPGTLTPATATAATVNRVVGLVNIGTMAINSTTAWTDAYNGSNIRSAISSDGTNLWTSGNGGSGQGATAGVRHGLAGTTSGSERLNNGGSNMRVVNIFNGQLYVSSATGTFQGVSTVGTGVPDSDDGAPESQALTLLNGFPTASGPSPYDFFFKDANTLYVADDRATGSGGGIQKWTLSAGLWSLQYTLNSGLAAGTRGLDGSISGSGDAILYATTGAALVKVIDTGAASAFTTLATAPTNTAFRGVELINIPEPASLVLLALGGLTLFGLLRRRR